MKHRNVQDQHDILALILRFWNDFLSQNVYVVVWESQSVTDTSTQVLVNVEKQLLHIDLVFDL
jgi:hypothetical protein